MRERVTGEMEGGRREKGEVTRGDKGGVQVVYGDVIGHWRGER